MGTKDGLYKKISISIGFILIITTLLYTLSSFKSHILVMIFSFSLSFIVLGKSIKSSLIWGLLFLIIGTFINNIYNVFIVVILINGLISLKKIKNNKK
ncbi:hypothetical protein [Herpetosiphon gulosus]|uniref:Uncharacterized protein n=1 Tax=Herpetosiphon gulosus TaxID=1973496 RepID=A0ABP9X465_9CHLR